MQRVDAPAALPLRMQEEEEPPLCRPKLGACQAATTAAGRRLWPPLTSDPSCSRGLDARHQPQRRFSIAGNAMEAPHSCWHHLLRAQRIRA